MTCMNSIDESDHGQFLQFGWMPAYDLFFQLPAVNRQDGYRTV
jgi:hypothetical protein